MTTMQNMLKDPDSTLVLSLADDLLMLGHIQGDWTGLGPILEEDIASSSMSQDDLSHALVLYEHLGTRFELDPDVIAYERDARDYRCCDLVTIPDEFDWATAFVRRWIMSHWAGYGRSSQGCHPVLLGGGCSMLGHGNAVSLEGGSPGLADAIR